MDVESLNLQASDVRFLPIVSAFVKKIGVVDEINRLCPSEKDVSPGHVMMALILDTLSGRSPLYRLERSFKGMDLELLLGVDVPSSKLNDDAVGRVLDRVWEAGTGKVLTAVALRAVRMFSLDTSRVHHDTTSVTVHGDYDLYADPDHGQPFVITYGFSKEHRPDLKQLVHSLLCVDHGIPIWSKCENGNESDKTINKNLMRRIVEKMRELGQDNPLYVADSALVTEDNLALMSDEEKGFRFVTRLPATYNECEAAVTRAVQAESWEDLGVLAEDSSSSKRPPAHYHGFETNVTLYDRTYRALVVHSSAHDKRKTKKLERLLTQDLSEMTKAKTEQEKITYACLPDAQAALSRLVKGKFHKLVGRIEEIQRYGRGRPKADGSRSLNGVTYRIRLEIERREDLIKEAEKEAGCFVLLTNVPCEGNEAMGSRGLLEAYKAQDIVERNFGFLKDDLIVNSLFLKSPARIEALGLVLVLSLMIWRLMERTMRMFLKERETTITGWEKRQTSRPTSFMMTTRFLSVIVLRTSLGRFLGNPFDDVQLAYLKTLGMTPEIFTKPWE
jgi:transposase